MTKRAVKRRGRVRNWRASGKSAEECGAAHNIEGSRLRGERVVVVAPGQLDSRALPELQPNVAVLLDAMFNGRKVRLEDLSHLARARAAGRGRRTFSRSR